MMTDGRWDLGRRPANVRATRLANTLRSAERWLSPVDLGDVLDDAIQITESPWGAKLGDDAPSSGRRIGVVKTRGRVRPALTDPERMAETVARLISVALEFAGEAASRPVSARSVEQDEGPTIEIIAQRSEDRGPMPSAVAELDLFLARHFAALHGGWLEVVARGGVLSMVLTLPAVDASSEYPTPIPPAPASRPRGRKGGTA